MNVQNIYHHLGPVPCPPHILQNHRGQIRHLALPITPQIATRLANQAHIPSPASSRPPTLREGSRRLCNHSSSESVSPHSVLHPAPSCLVSAFQRLYQGVCSALSRPRQHRDPCTSQSERCILSNSHLPPGRRSRPLGLSSVVPSLHISPISCPLVRRNAPTLSLAPGPHRSYTGCSGRARWCQSTRCGGEFRCASHCPSGYTIVILM